jgi:hypothetical protein
MGRCESAAWDTAHHNRWYVNRATADELAGPLTGHSAGDPAARLQAERSVRALTL